MLYTALLQHLGCTAYAHEGARVWGDDVVTTRVNFLSDSGELADMWRIWVPGMAQATGRSKARVLATTVVTAKRMEAEGPAATCEVARSASQGLGLPEAVQAGLIAHVCDVERQGLPEHCRRVDPVGGPSHEGRPDCGDVRLARK